MKLYYPSDQQLETISKWKFDDPSGLIKYVEELWSYPNYITSKTRGDEVIISISTGGWSGNEDIIGALMDNIGFWASYWYSSKRGGHYKFIIPKEEQ